MTLISVAILKDCHLWRFYFIILSSVTNSQRSIVNLQKGGQHLMRKLSQNQDTSLGCIYPCCERFYHVKCGFLNWYGVQLLLVQGVMQNSWIYSMLLLWNGHGIALLPLLKDNSSCNFLVLYTAWLRPLSIFRTSSWHLELRSNSFLLLLIFTFPSTDFIEVLTQEELSPLNLSVLS